jgi:hypothetical protein
MGLGLLRHGDVEAAELLQEIDPDGEVRADR